MSLALLREERFHRIERQVSWLPGLIADFAAYNLPSPNGQVVFSRQPRFTVARPRRILTGFPASKSKLGYVFKYLVDSIVQEAGQSKALLAVFCQGACRPHLN
jgi:hypothetical protein